MLPTEELFWLNIEEGYFACQVSRYLGLSRNIYNIYILLSQVSQYTFAICSYKEKKSEPSEMLQMDGYTVDYIEPAGGET